MKPIGHVITCIAQRHRATRGSGKIRTRAMHQPRMMHDDIPRFGWMRNDIVILPVAFNIGQRNLLFLRFGHAKDI